ncbi:putative host specificity protein, partial [Escherichia coli TT12B]
VRERMPDW